jgi:hypothetical protein
MNWLDLIIIILLLIQLIRQESLDTDQWLEIQALQKSLEKLHNKINTSYYAEKK